MSATSNPYTRRHYLDELWRLRFFLFSLVKKDVQSRYRYSFFGIGWSLARPLAMSTIFCVVFSKIFNLPIVDYAPYLILGLTVWSFLVESTTLGSMTFKQAAGYIRQRPMPLALFPLRTVLAISFHASISLAIAITLTFCFRGFQGFSFLVVLPSFVLLFVLGWSVAAIAGILNCYFPDVQHMLDILLQFIFYLTPILYPLELVAAPGSGLWLLRWNPLVYVLDVVREPVLHGRLPPLESYLIVVGLAAGMFLLALYLLHRLGRRIIFWIY